MAQRKNKEYTFRERMADQLVAYPDGCKDTQETVIDDGDYAIQRREYARNLVKVLGTRIALGDGLYELAARTDQQIATDKKPDHVVTWFDFGMEFDEWAEGQIGSASEGNHSR